MSYCYFKQCASVREDASKGTLVTVNTNLMFVCFRKLHVGLALRGSVGSACMAVQLWMTAAGWPLAGAG